MPDGRACHGRQACKADAPDAASNSSARLWDLGVHNICFFV